jgi:hypothetical protein
MNRAAGKKVILSLLELIPTPGCGPSAHLPQRRLRIRQLTVLFHVTVGAPRNEIGQVVVAQPAAARDPVMNLKIL